MRLGVDIGGTFTDLVAYDPARGETVVSKVLGQGAGPQRDVSSALAAASISPDGVTQLTHGTTAVTNLLIERTGAEVGVIATRGFRDLLEIQQSYRQRSIDIDYDKTPPIVPRQLRLEVSGRIDAAGREIPPLDETEVESAVREYRDLARSLTPSVEELNDAYLAFLRENGIYVHKRYVNRAFISALHDEADIDRTADLVTEFLHRHRGELAA